MRPRLDYQYDTRIDQGTPLQRNIGSLLCDHIGNQMREDVLRLVGNEEWWTSFKTALMQDRHYFKADGGEKHAMCRGKVTEKLGQTFLLDLIQRGKSAGNIQMYWGDDAELFEFGSGYWRYKDTYNVEFFRDRPTALKRREPLTEADMVCTNSTEEEICLLDFSRDLQKISGKAEADAALMPQLEGMIKETGQKITKLHLGFLPSSRPEIRPFYWNHRAVPGVQLSMLPGLSIVHAVGEAAESAWNQRRQFSVFAKELESRVE
jgi:hypothetical protein